MSADAEESGCSVGVSDVWRPVEIGCAGPAVDAGEVASPECIAGDSRKVRVAYPFVSASEYRQILCSRMYHLYELTGKCEFDLGITTLH